MNLKKNELIKSIDELYNLIITEILCDIAIEYNINYYELLKYKIIIYY